MAKWSVEPKAASPPAPIVTKAPSPTTSSATSPSQSLPPRKALLHPQTDSGRRHVVNRVARGGAELLHQLDQFLYLVRLGQHGIEPVVGALRHHRVRRVPARDDRPDVLVAF